jgi:hypothetical protein
MHYVGRGLLVNSIGRRLGNAVCRGTTEEVGRYFHARYQRILGENDPRNLRQYRDPDQTGVFNMVSENVSIHPSSMLFYLC